jgi:hypothetical protein
MPDKITRVPDRTSFWTCFRVNSKRVISAVGINDLRVWFHNKETRFWRQCTIFRWGGLIVTEFWSNFTGETRRKSLWNSLWSGAHAKEDQLRTRASGCSMRGRASCSADMRACELGGRGGRASVRQEQRRGCAARVEASERKKKT